MQQRPDLQTAVDLAREQGQYLAHQIRRVAAMVHAQHQRQARSRHVGILFVEGRNHFGQYQHLTHRRNLLALQATRIAAAIHAFMVLQHRDLHRQRVNALLTQHPHRGDRVRHQLLAFRRCQLVFGVGPARRHVEHADVVQQPGRGQRHAFALGPARLDGEVQRHQHHLQAVGIEFGPLLAHQRELERDGPGQGHEAQRREQTVDAAERGDQAAHQAHGFALHHDFGFDGLYADHVVDHQMVVYRFTQRRLHQPVIEAAVDARTAFDQLDALVGEDRAVRDDVIVFGQLRDRPQEMHAVAQIVRNRIRVWESTC